MELIAAANTIGTMNQHVFGARRAGTWALLVIVSVIRKGDENRVKAEFVDSATHEQYNFTCLSERPMFTEGDFVHLLGNQISFVSRETVTPLVFKPGTRIIETEAVYKPENTPSPRVVTKTTEPKPEPARIIRSKKPKKLKSELKPEDMSEKEMGQFTNKEMSIENLLYRVSEPVYTMASNGIRKPADVADKLNKLGLYTAKGQKWTPRLAFFLLALIFESDKYAAKIADRKAPRKKKAKMRPPIEKTPPTYIVERKRKRVAYEKIPTPRAFNSDEIADRLSRLGRVVRSKDQA